MSTDTWTGRGYDAEPGSDNSLFFRLKEKGQSARLRLVSEAHRYLDIIEADGEHKEIKKCAWVAILKEMVGGKPSKRVVVFQGGPQIYGHIRTLTESPDWGDATQYDVTVTRTEVQGQYYTVTPMPKPMGPLSEEEQALVDQADVHLDAIVRKQMEKAGYKVGETRTGEEADDPFAEDS